MPPKKTHRTTREAELAKTTVVFFPFDLFGSGGTGAGANLIADELREILDDNRRERTATRAQCYKGQVQVREFTFETLPDYQDWRRLARREVRQIMDRGEFLLWVTGNHLGALPVYEELGSDTLVIQLDAHLDIHHFSDCTRELSHGNFLRHGETPLPTIINVGHRELLLPPDDIRAYYHSTHPAEALAIDPAGVREQLQQRSHKAKRVFVDLDCDVFDPAYFPAVTQPMPFGLGPLQVLQVLDAVWSDKVVGMSISEFDPGRDRNDRGLSTLMWLIEYVLLKRYERGNSRP